MAPVYADQATTATTPAYVARMRMALLNYALTVPGEDVDGEGEPTTAEHALRLVLARGIISNPMGYGEVLAYSLLADGVLVALSTDGDMDTQIGLLFTTLASLT
jgi:hypothetical protein